MNKTSLTALAIGVVALVAAGFAVLKPAEVKLGSYTNGGVINGNAQINNLTQFVLGFNAPISTSTTETPAQFCATTNQQYLNSVATVTTTLPAASSTYLACTGGFGTLGSMQVQQITNDSTNTVNFVSGTGMTFKCETQAVGTTTFAAGNACTTSQVSVPASTTVWAEGMWDSASSSMDIIWMNAAK